MCKRLAATAENTDKTKLPRTVTDATVVRERIYTSGAA